jgi:hypothetical protein
MRLRKATIEDAEQLASLIKDIGWFETFESESVDDSAQRVRGSARTMPRR